MAKNLKLNIKNTQLAEALKLTKKPKVVPAAKKPAEDRPADAPEKIAEKKSPSDAPAHVEKEGAQGSTAGPVSKETAESPRPKTQEAHLSKLPLSRRDLPPKNAAAEAAAPHKKEERPVSEASRPAVKAPGANKNAVEEPPKAVKKPGFKDYRDFKPAKKIDTVKKGFDTRDRLGLREDEESWKRKRQSKSRQFAPPPEDLTIRPKKLLVRLPITIKDLASEMKLKASELIAKLFLQGTVMTLNDFLDDETTVQLLGHEFECEITIDTSEAKRVKITSQSIREEILSADPGQLKLRPPVVTFMGHVDHGKTSLIDAIRKTNLAAGEAGAITQHIGAFQCHTDVGDITILDTPGHEAFSAMRARGAEVTDIVVLVIAGDEGIRDQTVEAINQAKTAKVPIVVALNKCDKPAFNAEQVYRQLADNELLPESWGGTIITVNCSAITGQGIKELLEMLALQAEVLELRANPSARARGAVIESAMHKGLGAVATVLVQNGTLKIGDPLVFDLHYGRVKTMHDEFGHLLERASPSTPVKITGLSGVPDAGSEFIAVSDEREAREISQARQEEHKHKLLQKGKRNLESLLQKKSDTKEKKVLNLILRADVQGSLEALKHSLFKIETNKVELRIISENVGQISESDIEMASTSNATILGFHTQIESHADSLIQMKRVTVKLHDIIYHAVDDVKKMMVNLLDKIPLETDMGEAEVKAIFKSSQLGNIAGCQVTSGLIRRNHHMRLLREGELIWKGSIASLKRVKEDIREVAKGYECGVVLKDFQDFKVGDLLQSYEITYLEPEL